MQRTSNARTSAARLLRTLSREPLGAFAALWPLVLLTPFIPGIPQLAVAAPEWRQELAVSALVSITFLFALKLLRKDAPHARAQLTPSRSEVFTLAPLALFAVWGAASVLWATGRGAAIHYALTWVAYLLFFALARRAASRARLLRDSVASLALVVMIISAASLLGHESLPDAQIGYNGLGEPLAVATPFFAALAITVRRRKAALLCGLTSALAWAAALESAERAAFISACAGLLTLASLAAFTSRFRPRSYARSLLVASAFASIFIFMNLRAAQTEPGGVSAAAPVVQRLKQTDASDANISARLLMWGAAFEMFRAHAFAGVGAGNYEVVFPEARARFSEKNPNSPLVSVNEGFMVQRAHNEYLQMLAELGVVGVALFALFAAALVFAAWRALRNSRSPLAAAAASSLVVFALSSGASSVSFRWMGSGLIFFFAEAVVSRLGDKLKESPSLTDSRAKVESPRSQSLTRVATARTMFAGLALASLALVGFTLQGANSVALAIARGTRDTSLAESRYKLALALNPLDAATRFSYGSWLYAHRRDAESVEHLRYAIARGFNTSTCFQYLAAAEEGSGDMAGAERTLAYGVRVYPRSVFLRARHAAALRRVGRADDAELEMAAAQLIDSSSARGWQQLIENDIDAAVAASKSDPSVAKPGDLMPKDAVFAVLDDNLRRFPDAAKSGWRAQVGSFKLK